MGSAINDITHVIQLAVAPVFLLTAIATLIGALNTRLGRIVDRKRIVQERAGGLSHQQRVDADQELDLLFRRARLIYFAILSAVLSALLICLVVASAFVGALFLVGVTLFIALFFILSMCALCTSLALLLREVFLAVTVWKL